MSDTINIAAYKRFINEACMYIEHHEGTPMELGYLSMGMAGETGELIDTLKKALRNGHEDFPHDLQILMPMIIDEMGDVMWYFFHLMRFCNIDLTEVLDQNIAKLQRRMKRGDVGALTREVKLP